MVYFIVDIKPIRRSGITSGSEGGGKASLGLNCFLAACLGSLVLSGQSAPSKDGVQLARLAVWRMLVLICQLVTALKSLMSRNCPLEA